MEGEPLVNTNYPERETVDVASLMAQEGGPLHLALVEDEHGTVDNEAVQEAKGVIMALHEAYPNEIEALAGKDTATIRATVATLLEQKMAA